MTALRSRIESLKLDPARPVVAICLTAHRSVPAVRLLRERGFDAVQLSGGMIAWRAARLPEARG
jgi:rhodanese-related sulfurtransferase